jgi:hypothetical protein
MYVYDLEFIDEEEHKLKTISVPDIRTSVPISRGETVFFYGAFFQRVNRVAHYFYGRGRQGFTRLTFQRDPWQCSRKALEEALGDYNKDSVKNGKANNFRYGIILNDKESVASWLSLKDIYFPNPVRPDEYVYINDIPFGQGGYTMNFIREKYKQGRRYNNLSLSLQCEREWLTKNMAGLEDLIIGNHLK